MKLLVLLMLFYCIQGIMGQVCENQVVLSGGFAAQETPCDEQNCAPRDYCQLKRCAENCGCDASKCLNISSNVFGAPVAFFVLEAATMLGQIIIPKEYTKLYVKFT